MKRSATPWQDIFPVLTWDVFFVGVFVFCLLFVLVRSWRFARIASTLLRHVMCERNCVFFIFCEWFSIMLCVVCCHCASVYVHIHTYVRLKRTFLFMQSRRSLFVYLFFVFFFFFFLGWILYSGVRIFAWVRQTSVQILAQCMHTAGSFHKMHKYCCVAKQTRKMDNNNDHADGHY